MKPKLLAKIQNPSVSPYYTEKAEKQKWYLQTLRWILSAPTIFYRHWKNKKFNMKGLKPPYLLLGNHMAFDDFKALTFSIYPHRANYVVAVDAFIKRKKLLENVGGIAKRKFVNDVHLIRCMLESLRQNNNILVMYPEARYSISGTTAIIPESLGKFVKLAKIPVVTLLCHGHYLAKPVWSLKKRYVPYESEMTQIITQKESETLGVDTINQRILDSFQYDEFQWLNSKSFKLKDKNRAKGVHKVLYQCPNCLTEHEMDSNGNKLWCNHCGKVWEMDEKCKFTALEGKTEFEFLPAWFEWERLQVKEQIENNKYNICEEARVWSLPNTDGYIDLGDLKFSHSIEGFHIYGKTLFGENLDFRRDALENYSTHVEYDYDHFGDCIIISDLNNSYNIFPKKLNLITKVNLAVEEVYKIVKAKKDKEKSQLK